MKPRDKMKKGQKLMDIVYPPMESVCKKTFMIKFNKKGLLNG